MYIVNAFPSELATSQSKRKTQFSCLVHITTFIIHIPAFSSSFFAMIKHRLCKNQLHEIVLQNNNSNTDDDDDDEEEFLFYRISDVY